MPAFRVLTHYDLNVLVGQFARDIKVRPKGMDLMSPEYVIVQTPGMKRWLALECARRNSVFTQASILMPKQFIMKLGFWLMGIQEKRSAFERDALPWAIYRLITAGLDEGVPDLATLRSYAGDQEREMRLFSLAEKTADILDQYMLYRPEWIHAWDAGKPVFPDLEAEPWQRYLWTRLVKESGAGEVLSPPRFLRRLSDRLAHGSTEDRTRLPRRVSLFGMSILPPQYLDIFSKLGSIIDVTAYLQVPCIHYYGDFRSDRQIQWEMRNRKNLPEEYLRGAGAGNRLLRNLGQMGKEFMELILDAGSHPEETFDLDALLHDEYESASLLNRMQHDVLMCTDSANVPIVCRENTWSVRMAACYGPLREVEVLHDLLLDCFASDPTLAPSDVLVVTPDVARYGPLVQMVFGDAHQRCGVSIPFAIADQSVLAEDGIARFAQDILSAVTGRFEASAILSLFESAAELSGEPISMDEREQIKSWSRHSGIRWGYDKEFRKSLELPETDEFTWRYGLDRLIAGYVMDDEEKLPGDLFPAVEVAGEGAILLGRLADFVDSLAALFRQLKESRTIDEWNGMLAPLLRQLLGGHDKAGDEESEAASAFTRALASLRERSEVSGTGSQKFPFAIFMKGIVDELTQSAGGRGFLTGAVTVAGMLPMRSIPFRVVAMVGMNRGAFPRHTIRPLFDLMSQSPGKPGDRDALKSDRYVFLETLLSARDRLIVTWTGFDAGDGSAIPPSVLVDELRSHVSREYRLTRASGEHVPAGDAVLVEYPLHPFSSRYLSTSPRDALLSTWNAGWFTAGEKRNEGKGLFEWRVADLPEDDSDEVNGNAILKALAEPLGTFFIEGCRIQPPTEDEALPDEELFDADNLVQWKLRDAAVNEGLGIEADAVARLAARGEIPPGAPGKLIVEEERRKAEGRFLKPLAESGSLASYRSQVMRQRIGGRTYQLAIDKIALTDGTARIIDVGKKNPRRYLKAWICQLFLNLGRKTRTTFVFLDGDVTLLPLEGKEALALVESLNALARDGRKRLLPLILEVSWAYLQKADSVELARKAAWNELKDKVVRNDFSPGNFNPQWAAVFNNAASWEEAMGRIPGGEEEFVRIAREVFGPFLRCWEGRQ
jgi:exodeoxyribonuclease V gamma subunit